MPESRMDWHHLIEHEGDRPREAPELEDPNPADKKLAYEPVQVQVIEKQVSQLVAYTVVLTPAQPVQQLLPRDPERQDAWFMSVDNPIVVAESPQKAGSANNTVTNVPQPVGGYIPINQRCPHESTGALWAGLTTTATNSRVTVFVVKR